MNYIHNSTDEMTRRSPPYVRMKTSDLSPLVETIEVSEELLGGGTFITDNASDNSCTLTDTRNSKNTLV